MEVIDYASRASREGQPKDRVLTNVFLMLDHKFEQSVVRGMDDLKSGRYTRIPIDQDPIALLRKLIEKT